MVRVAKEVKRDQPPLWKRLADRYILPRIWYVHSPVVLLVRAAPAAILGQIAAESRPSVQRLHQRNLFAQGRRYHVRPQANGFRLTTTSSMRFRYRKRTSSAAVMHATCSTTGGGFTRLQLKTRMNIDYLLETFLVPVIMASILWYVPWHRAVIAGAILAVLALSWLGHRYNAALEANEMVWFVQKVLEDVIHRDVLPLASETDNTIYQDFAAEWGKFYEEKTRR